MKYSGAEIIVKLLEMQGVKVVAGIPGGANLPLYNALYNSNIKHILARHEQGAGFIAQGIARSSGRAAVCFATSGPGATNLITAIADAKLDSVPIIAITGQVASSLIGSDAFQEVDMYGLTIPICKHNYLVNSAHDLIHIIPEAFRIAESGRPGPVVIDVPKDIQMQEIEVQQWLLPVPPHELPDLDLYKLDKVAKLINESTRPMLYIGGGVVNSEASSLLYELAIKNSIPVASTLMGLGCFPCHDPLYLGMMGMHGFRYTNYLINDADLIIALGVRFDDRVTGNLNKFCPRAGIIHIDIDPSEIDKIKKSHISLTSDISMVLRHLIPLLDVKQRLDWLDHINKMKQNHPYILPDKNEGLHPINIIRDIGRMVSPETIITTDVGQHQMWVAQAYSFHHPRTLLTSGGMGTMGFGLPAAIGAALANPLKQIVCFSGDGSFLMNIQELATLADLQLNIAIVILNNGHLGLVRQQQELFYEHNYIASKFASNPDFAAIAEGFGIKSCDLSKGDELIGIFKHWAGNPGPCLINVPIHFAENVFPMIPPGNAITEMIGGESNA
ncbi:MAG: biosynthetic-type acetolactate synthase large subunit [Syntrophomonadaceae bacterium]|nr:biosynthetic-type acetolactate synthase large subunit [Syntrophomonadaceae bacterium]